MLTRSDCAPLDAVRRENSSDSDADPTTSAGRKRGYSQVIISSPNQRTTSTRRTNTQRTNTQRNQESQTRSYDNQFCTQRCLLGLQQGGSLDAHCPNLRLHQFRGHSDRHSISAEELVQIVKQQLDENLDYGCTSMGSCGSYGAPFQVTCSAYGYTIVGKGTTSRL